MPEMCRSGFWRKSRRALESLELGLVDILFSLLFTYLRNDFAVLQSVQGSRYCVPLRRAAELKNKPSTSCPPTTNVIVTVTVSFAYLVGKR